MVNKKPKPRKGVYILPNLFTVAALFAGFYAIIAAMQHDFQNASAAIFVAMLLDSLDGRIARLTNTQSEFGAQMDSLSDMVCFGLTPALLLYNWSLMVLGKPGWLAAFIYTVSTALRLARYNSQAQNEDKRYFQGLSTTAAAGFVASIVWVCANYGLDGQRVSIVVAVVAVLVALLKVSTIRYRSFKDFDLRDSVPFVVVLLIVLIIVLIATDPADVLLLVTTSYVVSGPIVEAWRRLSIRKFKKKRQK